MEIERIILNTTDISDLEIFLHDAFDVEYSTRGNDFFVIAFEDYFFRNNSKQLEMVVAKLEGNHIGIDVIGAAGGAGIFGISWGSENAFIRRFERIIEEYKNEKGIN